MNSSIINSKLIQFPYKYSAMQSEGVGTVRIIVTSFWLCREELKS